MTPEMPAPTVTRAEGRRKRFSDSSLKKVKWTPNSLEKEVMGWTPLDGICCARVAAWLTASRGGVRGRD